MRSELSAKHVRALVIKGIAIKIGQRYNKKKEGEVSKPRLLLSRCHLGLLHKVVELADCFYEGIFDVVF
jgi:hypothetical protein